MTNLNFFKRLRLAFNIILGGDFMDTFVIIFTTLVINGRRDFHTEVPDNLKDDVKTMLEEMGMGHLAE